MDFGILAEYQDGPLKIALTSVSIVSWLEGSKVEPISKG
jgi:hypothetical protein